MAKILINDGIHKTGLAMLLDAGFTVDTTFIPQDDLPNKLPEYDAICVRSATKVRESLINACPNLKVIGRGGVGLDNIDVNYARSKDIAVINTPAASSDSVAELAFAHLFSLARFLYKSNREMPSSGHTNFKTLKKSYAKGFELQGKTIGIIGGGRIGRAAAKLAIGLNMQVILVDPFLTNVEFDINVAGTTIPIKLPISTMENMLQKADVISLHIPFAGAPVISNNEFELMKDGVVIINASRGGTINENDLLAALNSGKVAAAGLDVFENEPTPREDLINHPNVSCTPHIGASTNEAQEKIGIELADQLIKLLS